MNAPLAPAGNCIVLFYKALVAPGGAERLLLKEYEHLLGLGYDVHVVTGRLDQAALFGSCIPVDRLQILGGGSARLTTRLASLLKKLGRPPVLCSSGHIEAHIACRLAGSRYALHIHHPCFMSFNDYDKYSIFLKPHFDKYTASNFGAARFQAIEAQIGPMRRAAINARAALSILSLRSAARIFVLSEFAKREKKDLYGVDATVLCGALEDGYSDTLWTMSRQREATAPSKSIRLLTIARLDVNKRIDELMLATAMLVAKGYDVELRVAGTGPERYNLEALANEKGLGQHVKLLGFVPDADLVALFRWADIFVSIDWADYKLTMFEALSHCLPCLVSDETECDPTLLDLGYIRTCVPVASEVTAALEDFCARPVALDAGLLEPVLKQYSWRKYFSRISECLIDAGILGRAVPLEAG